MVTIRVKPLSINDAYQGRRFSTPELKDYKEFLSYKLPKLQVPEGKLFVHYEFGVSSKGSDGDNLIKCLQDALSEKYGFNDNKIYRWEVEKKDVKKGQEYVSFQIEPLLDLSTSKEE